ncbi:MAG: hypothetical protein JJV95_04480 [Sulfurospirillum sp.]|nr:hypothetical protein [Sulfurospirillum sp.]
MSNSLIAVPNSGALEIIKNELKKNVKKYILVGSNDSNNLTLENILDSDFTYNDVKNFIYYEHELHNSIFDSDGNLSMEVLVPANSKLLDWSYALIIVSENNDLIATTKLPKMQMDEGIGMQLTVKIPVSGEAGTINFKANDLITWNEADEFFISSSLSNLRLQAVVCHEIIKDEFKKVGV